MRFALERKYNDLIEFLGKLSKRGFLAILIHIAERGEQNYNEVLRQAQANKAAHSSSQVSAVLKTLTRFGLLERTAHPDKMPIQITYRISKKGKVVLSHLKQIESVII
jgi:DNA-binding HxlR family transcriptional regulator